METQHPEGGESPFIVKDDASTAAVLSMSRDDAGDDPEFACCTFEGCGEVILLTELASHIEMHDLESEDDDPGAISDTKEPGSEKAGQSSFDSKVSYQLRNLHVQTSSSEDNSFDRQSKAKAAWKGILTMPQAPAKAAPSLKGKPKSSNARLGVRGSEKQL